MHPELSVVIPTHNRRDFLRACLDSFERQSAPAGVFEVVVVIDGSTDGTAELLSDLAFSFALSVVTQPQAGASAARNAGAGHARGRVLLFVDDDMTAASSLVAAHLAVHGMHDRIAGLGPIARRLPAAPDRFAQLRAEASQSHYEHLLARPPSYLDCYGGNCSVSHSMFTDVGGFSVDLPVLNDLEFAYRLREAGARFVFVPDALVTEERRDDWREIVADRELRGRVAVELHRRDPSIVRETELCEYEPLRGFWLPLRALCLALRLSPRLVARLGFFLPRRRWSAAWFGFAFSYAYWRGAAGATSQVGVTSPARRGTKPSRGAP
jgi:glycosyltransferase involved in cell wall biosynthesis